jgi:hypothetical protein
MRRRQQQRRKIQAFFISFLAASGLIFLFNDESGDRRIFSPIAQAGDSVADIWEHATQEALPQEAEAAMPQGFQPDWESLSLDQGRVRLKMLKYPYSIGQTEHGLGWEYFSYAANLFRQMAKEVHAPDLAEQLRTLSAQAEGLGYTLQEAGKLRYDGPPTPGMTHLKVREHLLSLVQNLNPGNTLTVDYNDKGRLLAQEQSSLPATAEDGLSAFLENSRGISRSPNARHYPQTLQLIHMQSRWLEQVAKNVTLRWDSTRYCPNQCTGLAMHVRVYVQQRLPQTEKPALLVSSF